MPVQEKYHKFMQICIKIINIVLSSVHSLTGFAKTRHANMHTMAKNVFITINIAPSINWLITTTLLPKVYWCTFSEACFWGLLDIQEYLGVYWMPLVGLYRQPGHLVENHHPRWWCRPWIYLYFATSDFKDNAWGLSLSHFTLKIAELHCNPPLCGYPPPLYKCLWCW